MLEERGAPVRSWSFERHAKLHASPLPRRPGTCGRVLLAVLTALLFAGVGCGSEGSTDAGNRSDDRPTDPVIVDDDAQVGVASSTHEPDDDLDEARTPEDAESWMGVPWRASPSRYSETIEVWTRGQVDGDPACQTLLAKMVAVSEREVELHRFTP